VVPSSQILNNGTNPDSIETESLDIVEVVDDTLVSSTAVVAEVSACIFVSVGSGKSIGKDLID